jgi:GT2 family glycosyltransferase
MVVQDPDERLELALSALASQDYPDLTVLVVDVGSEVDPSPRVHEELPDSFVLSLDSNDHPGVAPAFNAARSEVAGAHYLLYCESSVVLAPGAVEAMVTRAGETGAAVVGPKLVDAFDPTRLVSVGHRVDRLGLESQRVREGELDQEQFDTPTEVFSVAPPVALLDAEVLDRVGGFDEEIPQFGQMLDLCWRVHLAGHDVVVAPTASAAWNGHTGTGASTPSQRRRRRRRHRLRSVFANYRLRTLLWIVPLLVLHDIVEVASSVVLGRFERVSDVVRSWSWNLARSRTLHAKRSQNRKLRTRGDRQVGELMIAPRSRLRRSVKRRINGDEPDLDLSLSAVARDRLRASVSPQSIGAWFAAMAVLAFGSRHLLSGLLPQVGTFLGVGADRIDLGAQWVDGVGRGTDAAVPSSFGVLALLAGLLPGEVNAALTVVTLAMLPLGALGAWHLARNLDSGRARIACLVAYLAIPLPYNAIAEGDLDALVVWAFVPFVLARLIDASGLAPLAGERGPWVDLFGLSVVLAAGAVLSPVIVVIAMVMAVALAAGAALHGTLQGSLRVLVTTVLAAVLATLAHLPWSLELIADPSRVLGFASTGPTGAGPARLLRFETGPHGAGVLLYGLLVAALVAPLVGRRWRLAASLRLWTVAVVAWVAAMVVDVGELTSSAPSSTTILAPAAGALALCIGLGVVALERDLRAYRFGWRQATPFIAPLAVAVAVLPVLGSSLDGRWDMPRRGVPDSLGFLADDLELSTDTTEAVGVLWLGHPDVMPVAHMRVTDDVVAAVVDNGPVQFEDRWVGEDAPALLGANRSGDGLVTAIRSLQRVDGSRFGAQLAPMGINHIVVVEANAPHPLSTVERPAPQWLTDGLGRQLDLRESDLNQSVVLYENEVEVSAAAVITDSAAVERRAQQVAGVGLAASLLIGLSASMARSPRRRSPAPEPARVGKVAAPSASAGANSIDLRGTGSPIPAPASATPPRPIDLREPVGSAAGSTAGSDSGAAASPVAAGENRDEQ